MSDKEKIKEEIKRLKQTNGYLPVDNHEICDAYRARGYQFACDDILQFIDSLPEEPAREDLVEAARYYLLNNHTSPLNNILHQADLKVEMQYHKDIENAFKAGAHWQHGKDFDDLLQSEMEFPKEFYEKGKADAMKEMKETLQTEYEKGRFDMQQEMMKDANRYMFLSNEIGYAYACGCRKTMQVFFEKTEKFLSEKVQDYFWWNNDECFVEFDKENCLEQFKNYIQNG